MKRNGKRKRSELSVRAHELRVIKFYCYSSLLCDFHYYYRQSKNCNCVNKHENPQEKNKTTKSSRKKNNIFSVFDAIVLSFSFHRFKWQQTIYVIVCAIIFCYRGLHRSLSLGVFACAHSASETKELTDVSMQQLCCSRDKKEQNKFVNGFELNDLLHSFVNDAMQFSTSSLLK